MNSMDHTPGFLRIVNDAKSRIRQIDIDGYKDLLAAGDKHLLIDVREDREFDAAHAAGAMHLGKGVIERDIERTVPDKGTKMVLYCGGGFRSALAADALQTMGYTNVASMDGGIREWREKGFPLTRRRSTGW